MLVLSYKKQASKNIYLFIFFVFFKLDVSQKETCFQAREQLLLLQISSLRVQLLAVVKSKRDARSVPAQESTTAQVQTCCSSLHTWQLFHTVLSAVPHIYFHYSSFSRLNKLRKAAGSCVSAAERCIPEAPSQPRLFCDFLCLHGMKWRKRWF